MSLSEEELARKDKIKKHLQYPEYYPEDIFETSNSMCQGGCEDYMTIEEEEAGWDMCMDCKFEAMD